MEEILALARKSAQEAEVYYVSSEETSVRFEANRLKHMQTSQSTSIALRVVKNGRTGYATTNDTANAARLVQDALDTAEFGSEARFTLPGKDKYPEVEVYDPAVNDVPVKDMVRLGEEMISAVRESTPAIMCDASIGRDVAHLRIMNSRGGAAEYRKSYFGMGVEGTLVNGQDMLFVWDSDSSCRPLSDPKHIIDTVLLQLERTKNRAKAPTKSLPVIFTPDGFASALIMPLLSAFNGKTVLEGASPLANKMGETVFDNNFNIYDDPTIPYRPASRPCDDEGVKSRRTPLIEKGTVRNFYYDLQTAAKAGKKSTGNGSRGRGSLPTPSPSATVITPGTTTFDEMVKSIKEGLVVEQLMGAGQGNFLAGDFSGNVLLGYKIENGQITGRVKDTMVSGNVYSIFKDIAAVGSESKWVGGFLFTPPFYCEGLAVSSKG